MNTFISFLRGINVGGHRLIKMPELVAIYKTLGFQNIRFYLQTGNLIFDVDGMTARKCAEVILKRINEEIGYEIGLVIKTPVEFRKIVASNPFSNLNGFDKRVLHTTILSHAPGVALDELKLPLFRDERAVLIGDAIYIHCPNGYGRTKLTNAYFEKALGVTATTRNWNTIASLEKLIAQ